MLVLSRHPGEKIIIGEDIEVTLVRVKGENLVRIGIDAPREVSIVRKELLEPVSDANHD